MLSFIPRINLRENSASSWFYYKKLFWELSVEEVAPLTMWAQQGQLIAAARNCTGLATLRLKSVVHKV
jgi:hypothetical protein